MAEAQSDAFQKAEQTTPVVLVVESAAFVSNPQTAKDNLYQNTQSVIDPEQARAEQQAFRDTMAQLGVQVIPVPGRVETPDDVFPNNWFSTHHLPSGDEVLVLYPMKAENRRLERDNAITDVLKSYYESRDNAHIVDLIHHEKDGKFLEGTGSLVLDREHRVAYMAISERADPDIGKEWAEKLDYNLLTFASRDPMQGNTPIYHTNVLMHVGRDMAVLASETIPDEAERNSVLDMLAATGKAVLNISAEQMGQFAGNMLEIQNAQGESILMMSDTAWHALTPEQQQLVKDHHDYVVHPPFEITEKGGGSIRCSIAEIHCSEPSTLIDAIKSAEQPVVLTNREQDQAMLDGLTLDTIARAVEDRNASIDSSHHIESPYIEKGRSK